MKTNSMLNKNIHAKHRERLREKILKYGFESLHDHEKLEVILFSSLHRVNTNEIAHRLLERFGSFSAVLDASPEEIASVYGVGKISAFDLSLLPEIFTYYMKDKLNPQKRFSTIDEIGKYVTSKFINCDVEMLYIFCFDAKSNLISEKLIHTGTIKTVGVDFDKIGSEVFSSKASKFVIAHNHPGGVCLPSSDDLDVTKEIEKIFEKFSAEFYEHFIVVGDDYIGIKK